MHRDMINEYRTVISKREWKGSLARTKRRQQTNRLIKTRHKVQRVDVRRLKMCSAGVLLYARRCTSRLHKVPVIYLPAERLSAYEVGL
jgi:hypothetical protein